MKKHTQESVGSVFADPGNLDTVVIERTQGGKRNALQAEGKNVQVERACRLCRVLSEIFILNIIDPPCEDQCE